MEEGDHARLLVLALVALVGSGPCGFGWFWPLWLWSGPMWLRLVLALVALVRACVAPVLACVALGMTRVAR